MHNMKDMLKKIWRKPYQWRLRARLRNHDFSLISCNCIGGVLAHDLGEQFRSPTVNLTVKDYLNFVTNLRYYLQLTPKDGGMHERFGYPICELEDLKLAGVHYHSAQEMISAWEKRKKRINWNNIFIMATDEYIRTEEQLETFSKLPYPKVLYVSKPDVKYDFQVYIPGFEKEPCVGDILRYGSITGARMFEKYFDCVKWLNENHQIQEIRSRI